MSRKLIGILICLVLLIPLTIRFEPTHAQGAPAVVIFIVDDFEGITLEKVRGRQYAQDQSCAVNIQGQGYVVRGMSNEPIDEPHGAVVYGQLEEMVEEAGLGDSIKLVEVNIGGLTTDAISTAILDAIRQNPANFYVLNMSFVILPCDFVEQVVDLERQVTNARSQADAVRSNQAVEQTKDLLDRTVVPAVTQRFEEENKVDPLEVLFSEYGGKLVPVASAGNFGLDYPFYPAAWAQVISVSASNAMGFHPPSSWNRRDNTPLLTLEEPQRGSRAQTARVISNYGEVMLPGEYEHKDYGKIIGTSFAAPRLSFVLAVYMANSGTDICRDGNGNPTLAYGSWENLTLKEAVEMYCPAIGTYLP